MTKHRPEAARGRTPAPTASGTTHPRRSGPTHSAPAAAGPVYGASGAPSDHDPTARRPPDPIKDCCDVEAERAILAWRTWMAPWSM